MASTQIDLDNLISKTESQLYETCRKLTFLKNLKKLDDFANSPLWKSLHDQNNSHAFLFEFMSEKFGDKFISIIDNNKTIGTDFWNSLTDDEKSSIIKIDKLKIPGIHKIGNNYIRYVGSSAVIGSGRSGEPPIVGDQLTQEQKLTLLTNTR